MSLTDRFGRLADIYLPLLAAGSVGQDARWPDTHGARGASEDSATSLARWLALGPAAASFPEDVDRLGLMVLGMDWEWWLASGEGQQLAQGTEQVMHAGIRQLSRLLTALVRRDRFDEMSLAVAFDSGVLAALLRRAAALRDVALLRGIRSWDARPWGEPWAADPALEAIAGSITTVRLRRGMCYGPCPAYDLALHRDGRATFEGTAFVDLMGNHSADVDGVEFADLARAIAWLRFDGLEPDYAVPWTDATSTAISVHHGRTRRSVEDYGGAGPLRLHRIAELIDSLASGLLWTPVGHARIQDDERPIFVGFDIDQSWRSGDDRRRLHWTQAGRNKPGGGRTT